MNASYTNEERNKFKTEEYRELRAAILQRDTSMTQIFLVGLVANVTLIIGISAFYFNIYTKSPSDITAKLSYVFLGPVAIIIPTLAILISHRRDIRLFGSYIFVFYEDLGYGPTWETSHDRKTDLDTEEAHDFVPMTLWALHSICLALFWYSLSLCPDNTLYYHIASPLPLIVIMAMTHYRYMNSKQQFYRQKVAMWRKIRAAMKKGNPNSELHTGADKAPHR